MKRLLSVLAAAAVLAGGSAVAVELLGDRELVVPPPEAVAEGFVREVLTGRYSRANDYLARPRPEEDLRALEEQIEARTGAPSKVEAETISRNDRRALVTVRVSGGEGSEAIAFTLGFDGDWKLE